jgi:acyl carrier protein
MSLSNDLLNELGNRVGLKVDLSGLKSDTTIQDLGMDSLALVNLLYVLETDFGVTLKTEEILEINTVGDLRAMLESCALAGYSRKRGTQ